MMRFLELGFGIPFVYYQTHEFEDFACSMKRWIVDAQLLHRWVLDYVLLVVGVVTGVHS
jgi:hypothetical protein